MAYHAKLNISYCGIAIGEAVVISESCKNNKMLQEIVISWDNDQVIVSTADPFCNMSHKSIGNTGAIIVSNLLYNNKMVKKLDISSNNISYNGFVAISARIVKRTKCYKEL